jgi:hypothetical protein
MVFFISVEGYRLIVNASGLPIASLKVEDVQARYKTLEPMVSLNESFLDKFGVEHKDFKTLMEDWFFDEEWPVKKWGKECPNMILENPLQNVEHNDLQTLW